MILELCYRLDLLQRKNLLFFYLAGISTFFNNTFELLSVYDVEWSLNLKKNQTTTCTKLN